MLSTIGPGGPALVLGVVLAEVAVGGTVVLLAAPLWGRVRPGFFKLAGAVLAAAGALAWVSVRGPLADAPRGGTALVLLGAFAGISVAWQAALWARSPRAGRALAAVSVPVGVAALIVVALGPGRASAGVTAYSLLAGALFAGAATDGLLLGHWYLVDRRLPGDPLARVNHAYLAGAALAAAGAFLGAPAGGEARPELSPLLGAGALASWLAVGLAAVCALTGVFIRALVKERSMQAATGLFYLGVIMALASEFAAKVRLY